MDKQFLDREVESDDILQYIKKPINKSKILLLTGISGVGKSGLIEKISQDTSLNQKILFVKVSKNSVETIENLQYFNSLYKTVTKYAKSKVFDKVPSPTQTNIRSVRTLLKLILSIVKSKLGLSDMMTLSEPEENESIVRKKDYLLYVLKRTNIIIDIENIQNIDTQSLEILKEIICETEKNVFIFEYTLTSNSRDHFTNLYKEFYEICPDIYWYEVKKMDFLIAQKLAPKEVDLNSTKLHDVYEKSEGNLMEIILATESIDASMSNIEAQIRKLSKNERYLLYLIFLNDDSLKYEELFKMVVENNPQFILDSGQLNELIDDLVKKSFLIIIGDCIKIKHDSISDVLKKDIQNPILYCSYITLKNFYNENFFNDKIAMEKLVSLYLKFSDQDLLCILPEIKQYILNMKYPDLIIKKLEHFRKKIQTSGLQGFQGIYNLTLMLVEISVNKKMGDLAQKNLNLIYDESNNYHIALQAQIYSLQESIEAHDALCNLIVEIPQNSRLRLICEICLLYLKTKLYTSDITKPYGKRLLEIIDYQKYIEYAYLLRNYAELCDDNQECIDLYLKALDIFKGENRSHDMAAIYLSISMINAYEGNLIQAEKYIETAMELDERELSLCYVMNNKAALEILENTYSGATEKKLKDALLLSVSRYETIIVNANLLVYYCLVQNFEAAGKIAAKIENSNYTDFHYEEFLHIVYQDLYYFYSISGFDHFKRNHYYQQLLNLINSPNTGKITKSLAAGMNNIIESKEYYAQFPFRVDFLGYWEFAIDNDLNY